MKENQLKRSSMIPKLKQTLNEVMQIFIESRHVEVNKGNIMEIPAYADFQKLIGMKKSEDAKNDIMRIKL